MQKISELIKSELAFFPELGFGFFPVPRNRPYDGDYFAKYVKMASTSMGDAITKARVELVRKYHEGDVVDVGIGCGQFVLACDSHGYDVNPSGIAWLTERNRYHDIYKAPAGALTFWDVLEHIDEPEKAVAAAKEWVFVSIPIFDNAEHIIRSRHFRKDEHIWYFTHDGLTRWFESMGFTCVEWSRFESDLGRDGISTYAFRRIL